MKLAFFALCACVLCFFENTAAQVRTTTPDRKLWLTELDKITRPVIYNLANDDLKAKMPVVLSENIDNASNRSKVAYLEAFGRTLSGIGPWLNLEGGSEEEVALRKQYREWTLKAIKNAVDTSAKDYLKWNGGQPLVDASFFALGLIRCPWLWNHLDKITQDQVVTALLQTRNTVPGYSNWILFSSMIETFFARYKLDYDPVRIEYGVREFMQHWYMGDGLFSDGLHFHLDYYNSYVIQPYLNCIFDVMQFNKSYNSFSTKFDLISKRYATIQERLINTDGSYPVIGRSMVYRGGAFHHLADMAFRKQLPTTLLPGQVRCALTAVIKKTLENPSTFTKEGWLSIGLYGDQPAISESYITTGSLYLCTEIFLPLGLPDTDEFWDSTDKPWTSVRIWTGESVPADHALDIPLNQ